MTFYKPFGASDALGSYLEVMQAMKAKRTMYAEMTAQLKKAFAHLQDALEDDDDSQLEILAKALHPFVTYSHETFSALEASLEHELQSLDDSIEHHEELGDDLRGGVAYMMALRDHHLYLLVKVSDYIQKNTEPAPEVEITPPDPELPATLIKNPD